MLAALLLALLVPAHAAPPADPYLWLEELESPKSMSWVRAHNEQALGKLTKDRRYAAIEKDVRALLTAKDRLPYPALRNGWVYNFWQDAEHPHGLWRRVRPAEYAKAQPDWQVLLDVDALNKAEKQDWVWEGSVCLPPAYDDCLVKLSHGGKDAQVVREFDVSKDTWVLDGFTLPESKLDVAWLDSGRVFVGTDFGPGSMTTSGYPRIAKLWTRGQPLSSAKTILEGEAADVSVNAFSAFRPEGSVALAHRQLTFWTAKNWVIEPDGSLTAIPFPDDADFQGVFDGRALAVLRSDWQAAGKTMTAGSLVALPLASLWSPAPSDSAELIFAPDARSSIAGVATSRSYLFIDVLQNVQGKVLQARREGGEWRLATLPLPELGAAGLRAADDYSDDVYLSYESFLTPTTIYSFDAASQGAAPLAVKSLPARFKADGLVAEQREAVSADGTKVPYFLVHRKDMKLDGSHPTLLYGYGGFEVSMDPYYLNDTGRVWAQKGEVFALANIRGGGEFGPKWHEAALKEHRQRAYDDFIAVAEDLVKTKVTSPRRLGIMGGSNGGLLVGAVMTERPDLFHAVVCQVPLLDMLRYTQIAAGASWIGEYGDPADPKMAEAIAKYSPYQNVKKGVRYPDVFFLTSTKDDRVGPVHARKMAAKLEAAGAKPLYWENIEGGHGAAADLEERVKMRSLQFDYLFRELAD